MIYRIYGLLLMAIAVYGGMNESPGWFVGTLFVVASTFILGIVEAILEN